MAKKKSVTKKTAATSTTKTPTRRKSTSKKVARKNAGSKKTSRRAASASAPSKFAGETICFAGKARKYETTREAYEAVAQANGARIAKNVESGVTMLVLMPNGATADARKKAAALARQGEAIEVISEEEFSDRCVPTTEETLEILKSGPRAAKNFHDLLQAARFYFHGRTRIDLQGVDLRNLNLEETELRACNLFGADLRGANLSTCEAGNLENVQLDKAHGGHFRPCSMQNCQCVGADFPNLFMGWHSYGRQKTVQKTDFSKASMPHSYWSFSTIESSSFAKADLSDSQFEHAKVVNTSFAGANLSHSKWIDTKLGKGVDLSGANLTGADLRLTDFRGADLRDADLRGAFAAGANFSGVDLTNANFKDCLTFGATFTGAETAQAKNLVVPTRSKVRLGKACRELSDAAQGSEEMSIKVSVKLPSGQPADVQECSFGLSTTAYSTSVTHTVHVPGKDKRVTSFSREIKDFAQGLRSIGQTWGHGQVLFETLQISSAKSPVKGKALKDLVATALDEIFPGAAADAQSVGQKQSAARQKTTALKTELLAELRSGAAGVTAFNRRDKDALRRKKAYEFKKADLRQKQLDKLDAPKITFRNSQLDGVSLKQANLEDAGFIECSLQKVNLSNANLHLATLAGSNLQGAKLNGADLTYCTLDGVDLSTATLKRVKWNGCQFDEKTIWPKGFEIPTSAVFEGNGVDPRISSTSTAAADVSDLASFVELLRSKVNLGKLDKAMKMLKKERFQLFAEPADEDVVGVIRSQSNKTLVYACRLAADGSFSCCTQNLRPCGGLQGSLCKHLLVLIVGLAEAGTVEPSTIAGWAEASIVRKPLLDADRMAEVFLKYQGAEAGELDWRPVETTPEDFYV